RLRTRRGFDERERAYEFRATDGQPHADESSHRKSNEVAGRRPERFKERDRIRGERLHIVTAGRHLALSLSAKVERDATVPVLERLHLTLEHPPAEQQTVREDDRLGSGPALFVVRPDAVGEERGHPAGTCLPSLNACA